jgi:hypothetical protein
MDDDWIEIDRVDVIGTIGGKLGQPDHQVDERFRVRRRQAAKRSENLRAFEAVDEQTSSMMGRDGRTPAPRGEMAFDQS